MMDIQILQLVDGARQAKGLTVIIDVFRAFTTESLIMSRNAKALIPVGDLETARHYRDTLPNVILCGERGGAIIDGFDYGNSPSQVVRADFTGKTVVHTTSAGTQGIVNATGADEILGGCLLNAKAVACYIRKKNPEHVSLVCMGLSGIRPTEEDTLCAEYIKSLLDGTPLPDLAARIKRLAQTDGAKFFDPAQQSVFPEEDFHIAVEADVCPFVLRYDKLSGQMERIDVPEAFSLPHGVMMSHLTRAQVNCLPDPLRARIVYGDDRPPSGNFDAALVLGGATFLMESRAKAAAELYHAGRCRLFIATGGVLRDSIYGNLSEARILARYMISFGIPEESILLEEQATTTRENMQFCKNILKGLFSRQRQIAVVTSYGHLTRSVALANAYIPEHCHAGYAAHTPADRPDRFAESPEMRRRLTKELVALWAYVDWKLIPDFPIPL